VLVTVVPKDEIRLRIAAAKALNPDLDTWEKLAKATKISTSTLKNIATPDRKAKAQDNDEKYLQTIAEVCGLPHAWFTVADLGAAVHEDDDPALVERVEALEHHVATLMRRGGPTPPGPSGGGDPPPAPPGELGRRLRARATTSADPAQPGSAPEADSAPESAG
jgi:hypothetical protein